MVTKPEKPQTRPLGESFRDTDPADAVYLHLSERDRDLVLDTIDADREPNEKLAALAKRFRERYG